MPTGSHAVLSVQQTSTSDVNHDIEAQQVMICMQQMLGHIQMDKENYCHIGVEERAFSMIICICLG
jgi:hypothetical protein